MHGSYQLENASLALLAMENFVSQEARHTSDVQIVVDYIAGMTDSYATSCYEKIYWI